MSAMRMWRSIAGWSLLAFVGGALSIRLLAAIALGGFVAASVMTLIYMTRAAARELGTGYAVRHLLLAVALTPVLLLGIFIVPLLVQSDMIKWREAEGRARV